MGALVLAGGCYNVDPNPTGLSIRIPLIQKSALTSTILVKRPSTLVKAAFSGALFKWHSLVRVKMFLNGGPNRVE